MKRSYAALDPKERKQQASDEAFFVLLDGHLRSILLAFFRGSEKRETLPPPAQQWLAERGL